MLFYYGVLLLVNLLYEVLLLLIASESPCSRWIVRHWLYMHVWGKTWHQLPQIGRDETKRRDREYGGGKKRKETKTTSSY